MRLPTQSDVPVDTGGATTPMAAVELDSLPTQLKAPPPPRLQRVGHVTQVLYHLVAILVLLGGGLGGLAMHFGWLDAWWGGGSPWHSSPGLAAPTATGYLGQDTFRRSDQVFWGRASDGTAWAGDANTARAFAVSGGVGTISGGEGFFTAVLGPASEGEAALVSASISRFNGGRDNVGADCSWSDGNSSDPSLSSGYGGLRVLLERGTTVRVAAFQGQSAEQVA